MRLRHFWSLLHLNLRTRNLTISIFALSLGDNENFYISLESDPTGIEAFLGNPPPLILRMLSLKEPVHTILHFLYQMEIACLMTREFMQETTRNWM